jgi:hypothetical protein
MVEGENMTVLNLEDSKALYDKGIKIETKKCWANGDIETTCPYTKEFICPAPDLEELLEYARKKTRECGLRMNIIFSAECDDIDIFVEEIYLTKAHAEGEELIKLLVEILLKLKEEGYEV